MVSILHYKRFSLSLARIFSTIANSLKWERERPFPIRKKHKAKTFGSNLTKVDFKPLRRKIVLSYFKWWCLWWFSIFLLKRNWRHSQFLISNLQCKNSLWLSMLTILPNHHRGVVLHPPSSIILTSSTNSKMFDCITSLKSKRNTFYLQCDDEWSEEVQISSLSLYSSLDWGY